MTRSLALALNGLGLYAIALVLAAAFAAQLLLGELPCPLCLLQRIQFALLAIGPILNVGFSNRPFGVKRFQTIHQHSVDVARGLALLFGIGTRALPLWDSRTRRNNLSDGLAARVTVGPSGHEVAIGVVSCHRPERIDGWGFAFVEVEDIAVASVERLTFAINRKRGIDGILRQVFAETAKRNSCTIGIVHAINTAAGGVDPALAAFTSSLFGELGDERPAVLCAALECLFDV